MYEIDKEKFGSFVARLRKEQGMTQKELAERLFVSDKAVSKWERGLSLPDVSLLTPLGEQLGVTVTELLRGQRTSEGEPLAAGEVERLVHSTLRLSEEEREKRRRGHARWRLLYCVCALLAAAEVAVLRAMGFPWETLMRSVGLIVLLCLGFGAWACLFARETLPGYYDRNKISSFSQGPLRINLPGVYFNNRNWPHILQVCRVWLLAMAVLFPAVWLLLQEFCPGVWEAAGLYITMAAALSFLIPMIAAGQKYG